MAFQLPKLKWFSKKETVEKKEKPIVEKIIVSLDESELEKTILNLISLVKNERGTEITLFKSTKFEVRVNLWRK